MPEEERLPATQPAVEPPPVVTATREGEETHYHFPVEVVVVGGLSESDQQTLLEQVWKELEAAVP
jgi:hypothetical protein